MSEINSVLNIARKDLLDLGLRNSLINHRIKSKRQVRVIDELSHEIFRILVASDRKMQFDAVPDKTMAELNPDEDKLLAQLPDDMAEALLAQPDEVVGDGTAKRHTDSRLQTSLSSSYLQSRLVSIHSLARTVREEQGINTLYLALGFLHWYEAPNSEEPRRAPLLLIPVSLERSSAKERFSLRYSGEDVGDNLSLIEKLRNDFAIKLPHMGEADSLDVEEYFAEVSTAIAEQPRWEVCRNEITLSFFSFGKFLMYQDLDPDLWGDTTSIGQGSLLQSVLLDGFGEFQPTVPEDAHLDSIDWKCIPQVVDSDSSQTRAIVDALDGANLVLQGPPGTGKSQTITNLIAAAVGQGKKVLFVSEKMAALEVVKHRLDQVHLGDAALELHSYKAKKKDVIEELRRTLELQAPVSRDNGADFDTLARLTGELNAYCDEVVRPILNSGLSFVDALGLATKCRTDIEPFPFRPTRDWSRDAFEESYRRVETADLSIAARGIPQDNPFFGIGLTEFLPTQVKTIPACLEESRDALSQLVEIAETTAAQHGLRAPTTDAEVEALINMLLRLKEAPSTEGANVRSDDWRTRVADIAELVQAGEEAARIYAKYDLVLIDQAWDASYLPIRQAYATKGDKWWRFLSGEFRSAKNALIGLSKAELPKSAKEIVRMVDNVMLFQKRRDQLRHGRELAKRNFGDRWNDLASDWEMLQRLADWLQGVHDAIYSGALPPEFIASVEEGKDGAGARQLQGVLDRWHQVIGPVRTHLRLDPEWGKIQPHDDTGNTLKQWAEEFDQLEAAVRFNQLVEEFSENRLEYLVPSLVSWASEEGHLAQHFRYSWFHGLVNHAYANSRILSRFDRSKHEYVIEKFREQDELIFHNNRLRLILEHWKGIPKLNESGELGVIRREINKKARHLPIRSLMLKAGRAIQAMKPVFMMSPMSIATYIPPRSVTFDLVVFDEASQVKPVDAFGALLRGAQAVVVGDSKQLPPTSFFDSMTGSNDDLDEDDEAVSDTESILGLFLAKNAHQRMLRWHYRSQHDSLIAVSNQEFYDNKLVVFPTPGRTDKARGLRFHHSPETHYERGKTRANPLEAKVVAKAIEKHIRQSPDLSLGVVAFSMAQRDAIEIEVEKLRRANSELEEFFGESTLEPFFVKNLENVQGDERDVIFVSVGYGKTEDNYFAMSFGPLNRDGGERRLNVMITRAKKAMDVFANFTAADMDMNRTKALGVVALKRFLEFAETGELQQPYSTGALPESPFEEAVLDALRDRGYECEAQVGTAGFFIDIAIKDEQRPGTYVIGIECDGAMYHSSRSARDRDRLREAVLKRLGWRLHRVWSTDWFIDQARETDRIVDAIEKAKLYVKESKRQDQSSNPVATQPEIKRAGAGRQDSAEARSTASRPYEKAFVAIRTGNDELGNMPPDKLVDSIVSIVEAESPIHEENLIRRVTDSAGLKRAGAKIQKTVQNTLSLATRKNLILRDRDFLWTKSKSDPLVRNRADLPALEKSADRIAPEEISKAIRTQVQAHFSMDSEEAITSAASALGILRVTAKARPYFEKELDKLVANGILVRSSDGVLTVDGVD